METTQKTKHPQLQCEIQLNTNLYYVQVYTENNLKVE